MFGHPLHPIAVHFPVVLLIDGLDARSVPAGADGLVRSHTVFAILATLTFGLMAAGRIYFRIRHGRSGAPGDPEASVPAGWATAYFAFATVGLVLMVATGSTGGELVYGQGVGTIAGR